jgi:hypothetical protein
MLPPCGADVRTGLVDLHGERARRAHRSVEIVVDFLLGGDIGGGRVVLRRLFFRFRGQFGQAFGGGGQLRRQLFEDALQNADERIAFAAQAREFGIA